MNEYNIKVDFTKGIIQTNLKKLVRNDYNSTKLNFTFDKEGRVLFKLLRPDNSQYVDEIQNNTLVFGPGILSEVGDYEYEISLYTEDGRLTDYAIKSFEVRDELVNTDKIVEVDDRLPILDNLISEANQINNIDIDIEDSVITLKRKDGTTKVEDVRGKQGEPGKPGSIKFIVVNELPSEDIDESAIYMMPEENPDSPTNEKNIYREYIYVNGTWESLGSASVNVDMADYPTIEEVNNIVDSKSLPLYRITIANAHTLDTPSGNTTLDSETIAELDAIVKDATKKGYSFFMVYAYFKNQNYEVLFTQGKGDDLLDKPTSMSLYGEGCDNRHSNGNLRNMYTHQLRINMIWNGDIPTVSSGTLFGSYYRVLATTNTASYTPTADYHPATKKYVDDKTVTLTQAEYDALTTKNINTYYFIVEE